MNWNIFAPDAGRIEKMPKVKIHDTEISIYRGELPWSDEREGNLHRENFLDTMKFLGSIGFYVSKDKEIKKRYPSLHDTHRAGGFGDLRFKAEYAPNISHVSFYQDVSHENPHGGYYDFDKYEKMPYLIRKRFDWTLQKLIPYFEDCGFTVEQEEKCRGEDFIVQSYIESRNHPQSNPFSLSEIEGQTGEEYNCKDAKGRILYNGDVKYFRDFDGYLQRGKVYQNINHMWWILLPSGNVYNKVAYELFDWEDVEKKGRKKRHLPPKEYQERKYQLSLCSTKEIEHELRRRKDEKAPCGKGIPTRGQTKITTFTIAE